MLTMPKAALIFALLHFFVAPLLLFQTQYNRGRVKPSPVTRPIIVNFVKLGPKSAAPVVGHKSKARKRLLPERFSNLWGI
ncbi:MAG: hypothetical protein LBQ43_02190 [Holosporales bacterium]|nr:hypothetical protein [Holosporales bacterium]